MRALQLEFREGLRVITSDEIDNSFGSFLSKGLTDAIKNKAFAVLYEAFNATTTMDNIERMTKVAASTTTVLLDFITTSLSSDPTHVASALCSIPAFRARIAERLYSLLDGLRRDYLSGAKGPAPASKYLNRTRPMYEFVRVTLGIRMHGSENYHHFENGLGVEDVTVGENVSLIHEAIRDGKLQPTIIGLFSS